MGENRAGGGEMTEMGKAWSVDASADNPRTNFAKHISPSAQHILTDLGMSPLHHYGGPQNLHELKTVHDVSKKWL